VYRGRGTWLARVDAFAKFGRWHIAIIRSYDTVDEDDAAHSFGWHIDNGKVHYQAVELDQIEERVHVVENFYPRQQNLMRKVYHWNRDIVF